MENFEEIVDDTDHQNELIKNSELIDLEDLDKWTLPIVQPNQIYRIGFFDIKARLAIKSMEQTMRISDSTQTIKLLTKKDIIAFKKYRFLHIGMIQIAFKPLTLLGMNSSIMAYIRDGRCKDFQPSLIALVETSLCHGPVYFNVSPNLSLSLTDKNILDAVQLTIHTSGYNFKPGSEIIAVSYRICYKILNTLTPKVKNISFPGSTTMVQTNTLTSNIATNRLIKWDEINFPETWSLTNQLDPEPIINKNINQIIQSTEGDLEIRFNPQRSIRLPRSTSSRYGTSENNSKDYFQSRPSTSQIGENYDTVENINISQNQIPRGIYQNKGGYSPTQSDMNSENLNDQS